MPPKGRRSPSSPQRPKRPSSPQRPKRPSSPQRPKRPSSPQRRRRSTSRAPQRPSPIPPHHRSHPSPQRPPSPPRRRHHRHHRSRSRSPVRRRWRRRSRSPVRRRWHRRWPDEWWRAPSYYYVPYMDHLSPVVLEDEPASSCVRSGVVSAGTACCEKAIHLTSDVSVCTPYVDDFYPDRRDQHVSEQECIRTSGIVPILNSSCDPDQSWLQCCNQQDVMDVGRCLQVTPNLSVASVTCRAPV